MTREEEQKVVATICKLSNEYDYNNPQDVKAILNKVSKNASFQHSNFGTRYISRLSMINAGGAPATCILCGKPAENQMICDTCMKTINQYARKMQKQVERQNPASGGNNSQTNDQMSSIEDLFKDMDDSLMQLASQSTVGTIKKLSWINITLSIINSIVIFFLALFLWKFIMSQ